MRTGQLLRFPMDSSTYESRKLLNEYLLFHYGSRDETLGAFPVPEEGLEFPVRTVQAALDRGGKRALDLGCAVGRSSFELSRAFDEVIGIDFSQAFIDAANAVKAGGLTYEIVIEGKQSKPARAMGSEGTDPGGVCVEQGDAMRLRADLGGFDCIHAANLICRLPEPLRLIERLGELVNPNGLLILATPFTWLDEFTPRRNWLGSETQSGFDHLKRLLEADFDLVSEGDEPFLIRETARKYQFTYSKLSVWRRFE